jgi:SAM-dependent methyltransferase
LARPGGGEAVNAEAEVKAQVRAFYDSIGWRQVGEGLYQNARYEDLRPVSREYIHRCHLRVRRYLPAAGRLLLDAGSGPIQYPEYLEYARGFSRRICLDLSRTALLEARDRIGGQGRFVVGDIAALPFSQEAFDALVSLHTVHHLPPEEHREAFREFLRVISPGACAVVVTSWGPHSPLMRGMAPLIRIAFGMQRLYRRLRGRGEPGAREAGAIAAEPTATFTFKHDYRWVRRELADLPGLDIRVWRSVSTSFLRAFIHRRLGGAGLLRLVYACEERMPRLLGRVGQYPAILFTRPGGPAAAQGRAI